MKIMQHGKLYVEQKDILFLQHHLPISKNIWNDFLRQADILYNENNYMVIFTNPDAITFFQNQDIILDFDDLRTYTPDQIDNIINLYKDQLQENQTNDILNYKIETLEQYKMLYNDQKRYTKKED